jgi:predicted ribosomally synthesized peptide with SipW-like signal peptide
MRLKRPKLTLMLGLIIIMATVVGGTSSYFVDTEESTNNSLTAWVQQTVAKFFMADDEDNGVYRYESDGTYINFFNLDGSNSNPHGSAVVGNDLYILDGYDSRVYHYSISGEYYGRSRLLKESNGDSLTDPRGIAIDGDEMWVTEETGSIFCYSLSDAFPDGSDYWADSYISLNYYWYNRKASGLAIDDNYLYVADNDAFRIYRYLRSNGSCTYSKTLRQTNGYSLQDPSGCMYDGTSIWVVDYGRDEAYEYSPSALFSGGYGSVNAISEFALTSGNDQAESI